MVVDAQMHSKITIAATTTTKTPSSKRLFFDRRYGWVHGEWTDPSQEALAGGRGMFCILPLAKVIVSTGTRLINAGVSSMVEIVERPDLLSPQVLRDQLQKYISSVQKPELKLFTLKGKSMSPSASSIQGSPLERQ